MVGCPRSPFARGSPGRPVRPDFDGTTGQGGVTVPGRPPHPRERPPHNSRRRELPAASAPEPRGVAGLIAALPLGAFRAGLRPTALTPARRWLASGSRRVAPGGKPAARRRSPLWIRAAPRCPPAPTRGVPPELTLIPAAEGKGLTGCGSHTAVVRLSWVGSFSRG